jgi:hypothetical protein
MRMSGRSLGRSAFQFGANRQWLSEGDLQKYSLQLIPLVDVVRSPNFVAIAKKLSSIACQHAGIARWLPGVADRYLTSYSAQSALERAAGRRDMVAWLIASTEGDPLKNRIEAPLTHGIATMTEGMRILDRSGKTGKFTVASFWAGDLPLGIEGAPIAHHLLHAAPLIVLREPSHVVASLDGPVPSMIDPAQEPYDPSWEFAFEGELWEGAVQLDGSRQHYLDGIVANPTTRLYLPKSLVQASAPLLVVEWGHDIPQTLRAELGEPPCD